MSELDGVPMNPQAIQRAIELMDPEIAAGGQLVAGYLDLLGPSSPIGPAWIQRAMRSRLMPRVYEHFWRPLAARDFYGLSGPGPAEERRIAVEMLDLGPGDRALDVGCGPGNFTRRFARVAHGGLVIGLDASESMLAAAVRREPSSNLAYVRGDACALPFLDAHLDAVCCFGTLHLVAEPMKALDEMTRVLAPGGRLGLMSTWSRREPPRRRLKGSHVFGRDELTAALEARGYADVEQRVAGWGQFVSARKREG